MCATLLRIVLGVLGPECRVRDQPSVTLQCEVAWCKGQLAVGCGVGVGHRRPEEGACALAGQVGVEPADNE